VFSLRKNIFISLLIFVLVGLAAWPVFVLVNIALGFVLGEGSVIDMWNQEPKRNLIDSFVEGYISSAFIAAALGVVAALDYLILARTKLTGFFAGISVPIFCIGVAYLYYIEPTQVLLNFIATGCVLWIWYSYIDRRWLQCKRLTRPD